MNRRIPALLAAGALLSVTLTGCGDKGDDQLAPTTRGPTNVSGQSTCVYIDSPAECKDSDVPEERWFKAPDQEPVRTAGSNQDAGDFLLAMWAFHLMYSPWFSSPAYINHYVVVEHRTVYRSNVTAFNRTYASQERSYASRATYRTSTGNTVTGDKAATKQFQAPPPKPAPKNNGGDRGAAVKPCSFLIAVISKGGGSSGGRSGGSVSRPRPAPAKPAPVGGDRGQGGGSQHGC